MLRAYGFEQQKFGVHQGVQHQSYSMHQEEAWHSNNEYHNHVSSGVKIPPAAAPLCFDSEFLKHNAMFNGSHATNDGWFGQSKHQKQSNGWSGSGIGSGTSSTGYSNYAATGAGSGFGSGTSSTGYSNHAASGAGSGFSSGTSSTGYSNHTAIGAGSGFGSGTNSTGYHNHAASGAGSSGKPHLPAISVLDATKFSNGGALSNIVSMQNAGGSYETIQEMKHVPAATMTVQEVRYERSSANWGGHEDDGLQHCITGPGMLNGFQRIEPKRRGFRHQLGRVLGANC